MITLSTGLQLSIVGFGGLGAVMQGGCICVYDGTRPSCADDAIPSGSNLLGQITTGGLPFVAGPTVSAGGLKLKLYDDGVLGNDGDWVFRCSRGGAASWFRWVWQQPDSGLDSEYFPRIDGDVGTSVVTGDLLVPDVTVAFGQSILLSLFTIEVNYGNQYT